MKNCPVCKKEIDYRSKRCASCAEKYHWDSHPELKVQDRFCKICGAKISNRSKTLLCRSHAIKQAFAQGILNFNGKNNPFFGKHHTEEYIQELKITRKGKYNQNWNGGSSFEPYSLDWTEELRESIRQRDNYKCQNCGMTQEEHLIVIGRVLHVHHIDYNKQNCKEVNLITTCLSCNTRANFNRTYWQEFYTNKIKALI